ncbi:MAG TPA: helix-turn-helix transcriptional regulator [Caulobacteraceae bacterium]
MQALDLAVEAIGLDVRPRAVFSPRERDCVALLVQGYTDEEIAADLEITHATVRFHLGGARRKANARSRTHLAALAVALGVAQP